MDRRTLEIDVRREPSGYWAEVRGLEGCFASGETLDELVAALDEAISLYVGLDEPERILTRVSALRLDVEPDLRSGGANGVTRPPGGRKRQTHREDWPRRAGP